MKKKKKKKKKLGWAYSGWLLMDGGKNVPSLENQSHISYNNETWHTYTLPKEDPKNVEIT